MLLSLVAIVDVLLYFAGLDIESDLTRYGAMTFEIGWNIRLLDKSEAIDTLYMSLRRVS